MDAFRLNVKNVEDHTFSLDSPHVRLNTTASYPYNKVQRIFFKRPLNELDYDKIFSSKTILTQVLESTGKVSFHKKT